ncbi:hypothetical protein NBRC116593_37630 [Sulfitobacter pacificus]
MPRFLGQSDYAALKGELNQPYLVRSHRFQRNEVEFARGKRWQVRHKSNVFWHVPVAKQTAAMPSNEGRIKIWHRRLDEADDPVPARGVSDRDYCTSFYAIQRGYSFLDRFGKDIHV